MSFIIIYITHPDEKTANSISGQLIEKRLVACSNIFPISSSYWWKGNIEIIKKEIDHKGVSVVIAQRACVRI